MTEPIAIADKNMIKIKRTRTKKGIGAIEQSATLTNYFTLTAT